MSKLHEIFLRNEPNFDHGQAIKELIEQEKLDINATDADGNTVLHLMAIHIYKNYHNPYFRKDNPEGKFNPNSGYTGYYYLAFNNYKGPDFFDDLEVLLALGANPALKNNSNQSAIFLLCKHAKFHLRNSDITKYLKLIQIYHPHALAFIEFLQIMHYLWDPKLQTERDKQGFDRFDSGYWTEQEFLTTLDEHMLPIDCLEGLMKWVDQGKLKELEVSDATISKLRQRLTQQINCQRSYPYILDAAENVIKCYRDHKDILF